MNAGCGSNLSRTQFDQECFCQDHIPVLHMNMRNSGVSVCAYEAFHLHGLNRDQNITSAHTLTRLDRQSNNGSWHWRGHMKWVVVVRLTESSDSNDRTTLGYTDQSRLPIQFEEQPGLTFGTWGRTTFNLHHQGLARVDSDSHLFVVLQAVEIGRRRYA